MLGALAAVASAAAGTVASLRIPGLALGRVRVRVHALVPVRAPVRTLTRDRILVLVPAPTLVRARVRILLALARVPGRTRPVHLRRLRPTGIIRSGTPPPLEPGSR